MLEFTFFYIFGISISVFLSIQLFILPQRKQANTVLAVWLMLIALHITVYIIISRKYLDLVIWALPICLVLPLVQGIFLYAYTAAITNQLPVKKSMWLLHAVLPCIFFLWMIPFLVLPAAQQITTLYNDGRGYEEYITARRIAIIGSMSGYMVWSQMLLRRYRRMKQEEALKIDNITLNWLQYLIAGFGCILVAVLFQSGNWIITAIEIALVFFIGSFGIRQVGIFTVSQSAPIQEIPELLSSVPPTQREIISKTLIDMASVEHTLVPYTFAKHEPSRHQNEQSRTLTRPAENNEEKKKYAKSGLTTVVAEEFHSKLREYMQTQKLFTQNDLTLSSLAEKIGILPNYLSQIINEREGKTFYDYVNALRIEEFKRRVVLPENKNLTILAIAFDCGFNAKSSFNRCFKKEMNCSPSEYLEEIRANEMS